MSAPSDPLNDKRFGNRFWEARTSVGRGKIFETPEAMYEAAEEYFNYITDNPEIITENKTTTRAISINGTEGRQEEVERESKDKSLRLPFTWYGLCLFLDVTDNYFRNFKMQCKKDPEAGRNKDFITVIDKIEKTLYTQKLQGAVAGYFKEGITIRVLGLKDVSEATNVNINVDATAMTRDEIRSINEALNNDI